MVVIIKQNTPQDELESFITFLKQKGMDTHLSKGNNTTIVGLVGDTSYMTEDILRAHSLVEQVIRVQEPYKMANRKFHPEDTVISFKDSTGKDFYVGDNNFAVIAGPCSVESEEQIIYIAEQVKKSGAHFLRGGAFKPRTSPYSFQGLGKEGIRLLEIAKKATGLPIVTELMAAKELDEFSNVDIIQIGARNMQNFDLLKEVGKAGKTVLLKRGLSATVQELLMSCEYVMASGCSDVILCERGIRTFDSYTRNTLDVSIVPYLKRVTHLPVIIDPSHAAGIKWMVEPLSKAALAVGADGVMIEVHNKPECALCDGEQAIRPDEFESIMQKLRQYAKIEGKNIGEKR